MNRVVALISVMLLLVAACGDDDTGVDAGTSTSTSETTSEEPTSTSGGAASGDLPGERIEFFTDEGETLAVASVAADDVLNVRTRPGPDFDVVFTAEPTAQDLTATGHNRRLGGHIWAEVKRGSERGWANTEFLLQPGRVTDETATLYPSPSDRPRAETLTQLAEVVAAEVATERPPSEVTVVDGPSVGDLGEVIVDVIGMGDDAVGGFRLYLFAEEVEGGKSWVLRTVEQQLLCSRGVSDERIDRGEAGTLPAGICS